MGKRKRKPQVPIALLWTRRDQLRFIDAVERFCGLVNDLSSIARAMEAARAKRPRKPTRQPLIPDQLGNGADQ